MNHKKIKFFSKQSNYKSILFIGTLVIVMNLLMNKQWIDRGIGDSIFYIICSFKKRFLPALNMVLANNSDIKLQLEIFLQQLKQKEQSNIRDNSSNQARNAPKIALKLDFKNFV